MPKPQETATLVVNGREFEDWETVWVQKRYAESFSYFRFTAAERDKTDTLAKLAPLTIPLWQKLQFKPGDSCQIKLAGKQVIDGYIETRQVAYNANSHGVELIGKSNTAWAAKSSVDSKTGNFDNKNVLQVAKECLKDYPVGLKVIGTLDNTVFPKLQCQPGELIWDFLERIARPRGIILGSDAEGNFLLIGQHSSGAVTELIEGVNIKQCQCVITIEHAYETFDTRGQKPASDSSSGAAASEMHATVKGADVPKSKLITPVEQTVETLKEYYARGANEAKWHNASVFTVNITVQGWLSDGVNVWQPGDIVYVKSPMIMCDQHMGVQLVTFTQDNTNGTQTLLQLWQPWALNNTNFNTRSPDSATPGPGGEPI